MVLKTIISISSSVAILAMACMVYLQSEYSKDIYVDWNYEDAIDLLIDSGLAAEAGSYDEALLKQRTIIISKGINQHTSKRVVASLLLLNEQDATTPIDLYINTWGGWLADAFFIVNAIDLIDAPVNTIALGDASSSGAIILAAGTGERAASEDAIIMLHANIIDSDVAYDYDALSFARFKAFWQARTTVSEEWINTLEDIEYYISAEESKTLGIIDTVLPPKRKR